MYLAVILIILYTKKDYLHNVDEISLGLWVILYINYPYKEVHVEQYSDPSARQEYVSTVIDIIQHFHENSQWISLVYTR